MEYDGRFRQLRLEAWTQSGH